jgi:hypothetical protein
MAQELSDKIRAAAQAKGIDPEIALRIARAESSMSPAAQAKTSTAGGLFQVVDKTWKEFGGAPGKKLDADENIRVGTDIIAKNAQTLKGFLNRDPRPAELYAAHYFGPSGAKSFLAAEPGTPMESLFSKEVIKANPNLKGKTSDQVMASLEKKMGGKPAAPTVSRETPPPVAREPLPPSLPPMAAAEEAASPMKEQVANLGPGYQAALALSFLADNDDKEDRDVEKEPGIAEQWLAQQSTRPSVMAQFSDLSIKSPFAEPQKPQLLADGGEVEEEQAPDAGRPTVQETYMAKTMFPDMPVAEAVYLLRGGNRQTTAQGEMLSGNIGARIPLGKDAEAMLMLAGSRPEKDQGSAKALMAMLNQRLGEGNVGATLVRPMDAPSGLYAGNMSASYPLGDGRISGNVNAMRTPDGQTKVTGYGVGYGGRVGPGDLSAMIMRQKDGPYSGQVEYRLPIGRADGSPETGEVARLTPQQIEKMAEKGPGVTGINHVLDFLAQRLPAERFPTSARMLLETVQGKKTPITESNFSPEEMDVMRQLADLKGGDKGSINYADYVALAKEMNKQGKVPASMSPGLFSMADPMGNVQTTLGQFRYQRDPKGNLQIVDEYDFNPPNPNAMQEARTGDYGAFGPYGLIRDYAGEKIPPGFGRSVRVNLPPVKRAGGGEAEPTAEELEAASRPATMNPNIQRQGEAARRLAAMRDVNTLPDPRTYAAVSGFLGQAPDEMGFSVMHPDREGIKTAGQVGFGVGTALQVAPLVSGAKKLANFAPSSGGKTTAAQQLGAIKLPGKTSEPIFSPTPSADAPFVGRLDEMVANLQGPVQKDQFLGMLKGKMRNTDISRAESTLADLPGNAKLNPVDLLNRVKTQYDPSQFKTTVIPPGQAGDFYQSMDNPYHGVSGGGQPLGVIHLSQNLPAGAAAQQERLKEAGLALSRIGTSGPISVADPKIADDLLNFLQNPGVPLSEATSAKMAEVAQGFRKVAEFDQSWDAAKGNIMYPALNSDFWPTVNSYAKQLSETQGKGFYDQDVQNLATGMAVRDYAQKGNQWLIANGATPIDLPDFTAMKNAALHVSNSPDLLKAIRVGFDDARVASREALKEVKKEATEARRMFGDDTRELVEYAGQHPSLKNPPSPISFSRFSEHTTDIPGIGKAEGIYVNELQSDLLDDLRKQGTKGGSLKKDEEALRGLEARMKSTTNPTELQTMESQARRLKSRLFHGMGPNMTPQPGYYQLSESFAGMETSPQVAQQLMVKNAVSGAMQMGKQFVAFPGAESAQAQLYEKLGPNLKAVVKDLGPGFELRDVTLRDPDGKQLMHKAIVWGPEAASRVQKKGVPFKDGGAVERQTADHRKYL